MASLCSRPAGEEIPQRIQGMVFAFARLVRQVAFQLPDQVLAPVVNQQAGAAIRPNLEPLPY